MYFVVFWDKWCATIPVAWVNVTSRVFRWPPKHRNPSVESKKGVTPEKNWTEITYSKLLGPFDTFEHAREVESNTVDISTNDEVQLTDIIKKKNTKIPQKRLIQKPSRFRTSDSSCSSPDREEENEQKTRRIEKNSIVQSMRKTTTEKPILETTQNDKPPTNYKPQIYECCVPVSEYQEIINENVLGSMEEQNCEVNQSLPNRSHSQLNIKDMPVEIQTDRLTHEEYLCTTENKSKSKTSKPSIRNIIVTNLPQSAGVLHGTKNDNIQSLKKSVSNMQNILDNRKTNTNKSERADRYQEMQTAGYNDEIQTADRHHEMQTAEHAGQEQQIESHHECCSKSQCREKL